MLYIQVLNEFSLKSYWTLIDKIGINKVLMQNILVSFEKIYFFHDKDTRWLYQEGTTAMVSLYYRTKRREFQVLSKSRMCLWKRWKAIMWENFDRQVT